MKSDCYRVGAIALFWALLVLGCGESDDCVCVVDTGDPPITDLTVTWNDGGIWAGIGPNLAPDPIVCTVWLEFKNRNTRKEFKYVHLRRVEVALADNDSTLGQFPMETYWPGYLAPDAKALAVYGKTEGDQRIFDPPCDQRVLLRFTISNAEGDTMVFQPDTLTFGCVF